MSAKVIYSLLLAVVNVILSDRPFFDSARRKSQGAFSPAFPRGGVSMYLSSMHTPAARGWWREWGRAQNHGRTQPSLTFLWRRQGSFRGGSSQGGKDARFPRTANRRRQHHPRTGRATRLLCYNAAPAFGVDDGDSGSRNRARDWGNIQAGRNAQMAREVAKALARRGIHLVLHFDLNKTLIMLDPAGGKSQKQVLNGILSEICWGHVQTDRGELGGEDRSWRWDGGPPSPHAPPQAPDVKVSERLVTYSDFLHDEFGDAEGLDNDIMKATRDHKKGSFTEERQPGAGLRREFKALEQALRLPDSVATSPLARGAGLAGRESFYVLPAFFECLVALKEQGAEFSLVFRTFGSDLEKVAVEHNAFCAGKHPCFPGFKMDGSDGEADYRIHLPEENGKSRESQNVGSFFRDDDGVALIMGTLDNPIGRDDLSTLEERGHSVFRSLHDIHHAMCCTVSPVPSTQQQSLTSGLGSHFPEGRAEESKRQGTRRCLALRDYYPFWRRKLEASHAGKLLPVDLRPDSKFWPVIFDDNVGRADSKTGAHIVDVRDMDTGLPLPFEQALRRHLVRAEPYLAIIQCAATESNLLDELETRDMGGRTHSSSGNFFLSEILRMLTSGGDTDL